MVSLEATGRKLRGDVLEGLAYAQARLLGTKMKNRINQLISPPPPQPPPFPKVPASSVYSLATIQAEGRLLMSR